MIIIITILAYFCVLLLFSHITHDVPTAMKRSIELTAVRLGIWLPLVW